MTTKSRTADLIYSLMTQTSTKAVSQASLKVMDALQDDKVENQILGLAANLIILLNQYELSHSDVLGIADCIVFSGECNNMLPDFKAIKRFMKNEWEII